MSGGVACNMFIRKHLNLLCDDMNFKLIVPPPTLCNDNGIMIAWNGIEKLNENLDIFSYNNLDEIDIQAKYALYDTNYTYLCCLITKQLLFNTNVLTNYCNINIVMLFQSTARKGHFTTNHRHGNKMPFKLI